MKKRKTVICLLLLTVIFSSSFLLAKYISSASGSSGSKKVAKWTVSRDYTDNDSNTLDLVEGNDTSTQTYILKVISTSEVSARYTIMLTDVPSVMQVKIDDGTYQIPINNKVTFENANYKINASDNTKIKTHTLTFKVPLESNANDINEIDINLDFDQID